MTWRPMAREERQLAVLLLDGCWRKILKIRRGLSRANQLRISPIGMIPRDAVAAILITGINIVAGLLIGAFVPSWSPAQTAPDPLSALESTMAAAAAR